MVITSHGEPVAELGPIGNAAREAEDRRPRARALAALAAHWQEIESQTVGPWTRDELYDRD